MALAVDRRKGNPDYTNKNNQFVGLVKGEYGKTPVPVDPKFREFITGSAEEKPYDVSSYKTPANPEIEKFGGVKLARNEEEFLLLELLLQWLRHISTTSARPNTRPTRPMHLRRPKPQRQPQLPQATVPCSMLRWAAP